MLMRFVMKRSSIIILLLVLLISLTVSAQTTTEIKQIQIVSTWGGLGPAGNSRLIIKRDAKGYKANGKKISDKLISDLLVAIDSPPMPPSLENLGITQDWLNVNAEAALQDYSPQSHKEAFENQKSLFFSSFKNITLLEKLLPEIIGGGWTDDFPRFEMQIDYTNGQMTNVRSQSQPIFMLPWGINKDGEAYLTYNARISTAIANLLPDKFTNRERIAGTRLRYKVAEKVMREIETQWNWLDTENKIGSEIASLRDKYVLNKTAISYTSSIDVNTVDSQDKERKYSFPSWNATLQRKDLPPNVIIGVSIPFKKGKLTTFNLFVERIDGIVNLVFSVPWLDKYIKNHPENKFEIRFVKDRSFSEHAEIGFWEIMKKGGKEQRVKAISNEISQSAFLQINETDGGWSRWLVLPDRRMILWDFRSSSVLKWKPSDFETWDRFDDTPDWFSACAIITKDGKIELR